MRETKIRFDRPVDSLIVSAVSAPDFINSIDPKRTSPVCIHRLRGVDPSARVRTPSEVADFIAGLNEDEQADLVALVWIGRGTYSAEEFEEAVETAKAERTNPTEVYLLGIPLLADYLEAGLEKLGYTIEDIERDVL